MSIPEIFASLGEPAFRDGERRVIARLLGERAGRARDRRRRLHRAADPRRDQGARHLGLAARRPRPALGPGARPPRPAAAADRRTRARRSPTCSTAPLPDLRRGRRHRRQPPRRQPRGDGPRHHRRGPGARPTPARTARADAGAPRHDRHRHRCRSAPAPTTSASAPGLLARAGAEIAPLLRRPRVAVVTETPGRGAAPARRSTASLAAAGHRSAERSCSPPGEAHQGLGRASSAPSSG